MIQTVTGTASSSVSCGFRISEMTNAINPKITREDITIEPICKLLKVLVPLLIASATVPRVSFSLKAHINLPPPQITITHRPPKIIAKTPSSGVYC